MSQKKKASVNTYFQMVNFNVDVVKVATYGSCVCYVLTRMESRPDKKVELGKNQPPYTNKVYTFDVSKSAVIFDYLIKKRFITYPECHCIPLALKIKGNSTVGIIMFSPTPLLIVGPSAMLSKMKSVREY